MCQPPWSCVGAQPARAPAPSRPRRRPASRCGSPRRAACGQRVSALARDPRARRRLRDLLLVGGVEPAALGERLVEDLLELRRGARRRAARPRAKRSGSAERLERGARARSSVKRAVGHRGGIMPTWPMRRPAHRPLARRRLRAARSAAASCARSLAGLPRAGDPALLVGAETADDAGVVPDLATSSRSCRPSTSSRRSSTTRCDFGRIAAANALSDVYAMGGDAADRAQPRRASRSSGSAPRCWREILRGGAEVAARGRRRRSSAATRSTTRSPSTGMAVTGVVHPTRVRAQLDRPRRATCSFLTKPIGGGAVTTAAKRGTRRRRGRARAAPR